MAGTRVTPMVIRAELVTDRDATWRALTDPETVARWFARPTAPGAVGDAYVLDFGGRADDEMHGAILEATPGERLAYSWGWGATPPERRTRVAWDLAPLETGGTLLTLTHDGWTEAGLTTKDRDEHSEYWEGYVAALVELTDELASEEDD